MLLLDRMRAAGWTGNQGLLSQLEQDHRSRGIPREHLEYVCAGLGITLDELLATELPAAEPGAAGAGGGEG